MKLTKNKKRRTMLLMAPATTTPVSLGLQDGVAEVYFEAMEATRHPVKATGGPVKSPGDEADWVGELVHEHCWENAQSNIYEPRSADARPTRMNMTCAGRK